MSHIGNGGMLYVSGTGVRSVVAGAWFVADMGYGGYNYLWVMVLQQYWTSWIFCREFSL